MEDLVLSLRAIAIPPTSDQPPKGLIVALHGWGANAKDLASLIPFLGLSEYQFLCPDAPLPHPYAPGGKMWYNFPSEQSLQSRYAFQGQADLQASQEALKNWLKSLPDSTGIPFSRTFLAGFSQGGAMTIDVGTSLPLAGLMVLSGYLHAPLEPTLPEIPPVLVVHGRQDAVVPLAAAHHIRDRLVELKANVDYQEFDMGHEIQPLVLDLMRQFVDNHL